MNLDSLSFALYNISYSVANLTKKNFKLCVQEISRLVALHGLEAERYLIRCLFSHVDFSGDCKSSGKDFHQIQYLIQECSTLIYQPHFISTFLYAVDKPLQQQKSLKPSSQLLHQISKVLKLSKFQEIAFGIALLHSESTEHQENALAFLKEKLPKFLKLYAEKDSEEQTLPELDEHCLLFLFPHLLERQKEFEVTDELRKSFARSVRKVEHRGAFKIIKDTSVLRPYLYFTEDFDTIIEPDMEGITSLKPAEDHVVDLIKEMGYAFTASLEDCRNNAQQVGLREPSPAIVARILSMMARSHSGLSDPINLQSMNSNNVIMWGDGKEKTESSSTLQGWNIEVFVQVLHEILSNLDWKEVVCELDHPGFLLSDRQGLRLLWQALIMGLGHELFPMDVMYRRWRNAEGQFSFFQQVINCPEVVCLVDYSHRPVTIDALKAPPEEDNRGISNWKSLDLIETLLTLSETPYFKDDIVKFPVNQCPDLLLLGLIQTNRNINQYHKDLLGRLIPVFLNNHPNSAIVLHLAWHSQVHQSAVKNILMQSMADWYVRSEFDQTKLSRILDVAQDLKALSMLLNVTPFVFVIDLACLASRREYLKLDKWLADKIREHGEAFVQNCISFLRRRCPQAGGNTKEENPPKTALPPETLAVICHVLQSLVGNVSPELSETIVTVVNSCMVWNSSRTGTGKNARGIESVLSSGTVNPPSSSLDPLSGLSSSVSGMSLVPSAKTSLSSSSVFPVPRDLHPFPTSTSLGSPIKMLPLTTPTTTASSVNQLSQPFSLSSQLPQFGSQLLAGDMSAVFPELSHPVSKEIEDEANGYFQRIYNHPPHPTLSIDEVLEMLKRFMESPVQREKDVFFCMIRNLLEEYRFFPQYPDKELMTTAQLFGGIIEHNLVKESSSSVQRQGRPSKSYLILGVALRYVIDSLKKAQGSKMFYFGVTAMDKFKNRLKDYPQICQYISSLPTYHDLPPPLIEYIDYGVRSQEPPARVQGATVQPSLPTMTSTFAGLSTAGVNPLALTTAVVTATSSATKNTMAGKPSIANATNIDTLLGATEKDEKLTLPPESVQDKVAFIVNNLSQSNLLQKTDEFREVVKEDYWPWTSQYMVMKRASIEPNFHSLYSNFLDTLKLLQLTELIIRETFRNIKVLLRSDKGIANFSDRSLLKNLGHWLGMLTLAKSKPILHIDIDIKSLLIEAYHNGQEELLYVVPFIAKVLESCAKSRAFKPPNPWTMGIMNTLAELHKEQDLKLNLKFEIEVLCKTLTLDINDLKPKNILKDPERVVRLELQLSPLLKTKEVVMVTTTNVVVMPQKPISTVVGPATNTLPNTPMPAEETITVAPNVTANSPPSAIVSSTSTAQTVMPQPQFAYNDINVCNVSGLHQHMVVNGQLNLFQAHSQLKQCIRPALERAVQEWIIPVVERSIKISLTTCEQLIKKDFALDPEENRMRMSAHHMIRYLTAGMAMITCKDPLVMSISQNLKSAFGSALRNANPQQKEMIEQAAQVVAQDNVELACCFIQKTAVEKALPEIDKRLNSEYDLRKLAKNEGRLYCDAAVLTYQAERIPEPIRLKVGNVTPQQMAVYEEFLKTIPGFLPSDREHHTSFMKAVLPQMPLYGSDDLTPMYDKIINDLELLLLNIIAPGNHHLTALHSLLECVASARSSREVMASLNLLVKGTVEGLLDGLAHITSDPEILHRFRDGHLIVLKTIAEQRIVGQQYVTKLVARSIIESREELRYNLEATDVLIRNHLVDMPSYDILLAQILLQVLEKGLNYVAVSFAMQLVKLYLIDDKQSGLVSEADLLNTIDTLARLATARQGPDGLGQLLELLRSSSETVFIDRAPGSSGPMSMMHSGITQAREFDDPPGLHEKTEFLLREWVTMYHAPNSGRDSTKAFSIFVHQMNVHGILKTDELITRFFRISTEMCSELVFRSLIDNSASPTLARAKCFHTVDAFVRLIALLVKHSGDTSNSTTKLNLLNKVLGIIAGVLLTEQEGRGVDFQQLTYHRIFIMLFLELSLPDAVLEALSAQIVQAFANTFFFVRPQKAPSFAYAWLELVSHRVFLGRLLAVSPQPKSWGLYAQLLISLFKFLSPFLRNVELAQPIHILYKGTLRVLLVLLHDFPEFLCDYHYHFCDAIAPNCIQMRNLILSAFPRNMRLPDPFTPNLKVDLLTDIKQTPRMVANFGSAIQPDRFKTDLDSYIKTRSPVNFLVDLRTNLQNATNEPGMRYNIPLINALVLYVGTQAIGHIQSKGLTPSMNTITHSSHMDIFQSLAVDLDTEGRYLFLNAIANQLRYPNSHTHYFSCTLLYLFMEANTEAIQEQITRVLLERLIVNRPHPWGLLITFIELIKNTSFKFWNHDFVRCAPEIENDFPAPKIAAELEWSLTSLQYNFLALVERPRDPLAMKELFESVARSCMHPKPSTEASSS